MPIQRPSSQFPTPHRRLHPLRTGHRRTDRRRIDYLRIDLRSCRKNCRNSIRSPLGRRSSIGSRPSCRQARSLRILEKPVEHIRLLLFCSVTHLNMLHLLIGHELRRVGLGDRSLLRDQLNGRAANHRPVELVANDEVAVDHWKQGVE